MLRRLMLPLVCIGMVLMGSAILIVLDAMLLEVVRVRLAVEQMALEHSSHTRYLKDMRDAICTDAAESFQPLIPQRMLPHEDGSVHPQGGW